MTLGTHVTLKELAFHAQFHRYSKLKPFVHVRAKHMKLSLLFHTNDNARFVGSVTLEIFFTEGKTIFFVCLSTASQPKYTKRSFLIHT